MTPNRPASLEALLLEEQLVSESALRAAKRAALRRRVRLVEGLVDEHVVDEARLADAMARRLGLPRFTAGPPDEEALREVSHDLATAHLVVPVHVDTDPAQRTLRLAMVDPLDAFALEDVAHGCGCVIEPVVATLGQVRSALQRSYRGMITKMIPRTSDTTTRGAVDPTTQPLLELPDENRLEVRLRALMEILIERGVVTGSDLDAKIQSLLNGDDT
jgi:hypothetical protein